MLFTAKMLRLILGLILCGCLLLIFSSLGSLSFLPASAIQIALSGGTVVWFLIRLIQWDFAKKGFFLLFLIWLLIQAAGQWFHWAGFYQPAGSWNERINLFFLFVTAAQFYLIAREVFQSRATGLFLIQFLVVVSAGLAIYLIFVISTSPNPNYFWSSGSLPFVERLVPWVGNFLQPNDFVKLFFPGAFYALALAFYALSFKEDETLHRSALYGWIVLNLCFVCAIAGALFLTRSRAGILSFSAAFLLFSIFFSFSHQRKKYAVKVFGISTAVIILFLLSLNMKSVLKELETVLPTFTAETELHGDRSMTMGAAWQVISAQGLFGVGLGNLKGAWLFLHKPPFYDMPGIVFNDFLWMWAETGLPGIGFFLLALLSFMVSGVIRALRTWSYFVCYLLLASVFSVAALSFHGLVDSVYYAAPTLWLAFACMGFGAGALGVEESEEQKERGERAKPFHFPGILAVWFILVLSVLSGVVSARKLTAFTLTQERRNDEGPIRKAMKLDPFNAHYPEALASYYYNLYLENPNDSMLKQSLFFLDEAIRLEPFQHLRYRRRAEMFLYAGKVEEVEQTFRGMQEALPNFYLGEFTASVFYLEAAERSKDPRQASRFEELAIKHYRRIFQFNPGFIKKFIFYTTGYEDARRRFYLLQKEDRL